MQVGGGHQKGELIYQNQKGYSSRLTGEGYEQLYKLDVEGEKSVIGFVFVVIVEVVNAVEIED